MDNFVAKTLSASSQEKKKVALPTCKYFSEIQGKK